MKPTTKKLKVRTAKYFDFSKKKKKARIPPPPPATPGYWAAPRSRAPPAPSVARRRSLRTRPRRKRRTRRRPGRKRLDRRSGYGKRWQRAYGALGAALSLVTLRPGSWNSQTGRLKERKVERQGKHLYLSDHREKKEKSTISHTPHIGHGAHIV